MSKPTFEQLASGALVGTFTTQQLFAGEAPIITDSAPALSNVKKWQLLSLTPTGVRPFGVSADGTVAAPVIASDKPSLAIAEVANVTITFEAVSAGVDGADFTATGGTLAILGSVDGMTYTGTFTATAAVPNVVAAIAYTPAGITSTNDDPRSAVLSAVEATTGKQVPYYDAGKFNWEVCVFPPDLDTLPKIKAALHGSMLHFGHLI